ncbi:MAG TPA: response regulator [Puia sp.]|nr:response regulator [Puia sp.]
MPEEKINILIVEDESLVALDLATGLEKAGYHVVGTADHAEEALQIFGANEVDIVLMDIHLAGKKDGIDTVVDMMKIRQTPVIYLTAYTDAATIQRVKQTHPAAFLLKPYSIANVRIAIELAFHQLAVLRQQKGQGRVIPLEETGGGKKEGAAKESILQLDDSIFFKVNHQFIKLRLTDILYVEADGNHLNIFTTERKFVLRLSLNQLFEKLRFKKLVRIHRSYAVNIDTIQSFNDMEVVTGKRQLPIGRNYKEEFLRNFDFR